MAVYYSFVFGVILVFITYVPPCCDGNSFSRYPDQSHSLAQSTLPEKQGTCALFRLRGGMPHLSGKKRKAPEDTADGSEKHQNEDSSAESKSSEPDKKDADKDVDAPLDDSTVVIEGDDIPSDLHESGRHARDHQAKECSL
jgi:hypothetical protein